MRRIQSRSSRRTEVSTVAADERATKNGFPDIPASGGVELNEERLQQLADEAEQG